MTDPMLVLSFIEVTPERHREMTLGGLIHITDLELYDHRGLRTGRKIGDDLTSDQLGYWGEVSAVLVLVTQDGQLWIQFSMACDDRPPEFRAGIENSELVRKYAPHGYKESIFVPATCNVAETPGILALDLLVRLANPSHLR